MATQAAASSAEIASDRERYVSDGVSTPAIVAAGADGARIWDADGNEYLDFAGGIGCLILGHRHPALIKAIHEQVDSYLHQCFMVGIYEPYVEVCKRLAGLSPCRGDEQKSILLNSGAEAVENAVKIARTATGRQAVVVFDGAFHGRTLLTMGMTGKVAYRKGGPFAPEIYRAPVPYPYRGVSVDDAIAGFKRLFKTDVDPATTACVVLEPVLGEGGFLPVPTAFLEAIREFCDEHGILQVDDEVQAGVGRTGPMWAIEHSGVAPDLIVGGKSLGGGLPLASVTGRREIMDSVSPGGLGTTFGGNPVSCAAALATLDVLPTLRDREAAIAAKIRASLERVAGDGDVRGLGSMLALELPENSAERAGKILAAARAEGLILLACGLYGNVIRLHVPLVIADDELDRGLAILERAVAAN